MTDPVGYRTLDGKGDLVSWFFGALVHTCDTTQRGHRYRIGVSIPARKRSPERSKDGCPSTMGEALLVFQVTCCSVTNQDARNRRRNFEMPRNTPYDAVESPGEESILRFLERFGVPRVAMHACPAWGYLILGV